MNRIAIIGCGGAGKSTLARRLGQVLNLPVHHLDALHWQPGWKLPERNQWRARHDELLCGDRWIIDGNYGDTMDARLAAADTIIFLDLPTLVCLWRILRRRIAYHGRTRPDMAPDCAEQIDWPFLVWVATYRSKRRAEVLRKISRLRREKQVIGLRSAAAVERFVKKLERAPRASD